MERLDEILNQIENLSCATDADVDVKYILRALLAEVRLLHLTKADEVVPD